MKIKIEKKQDDEPKKKYYSGFQMKLKERTEQIDQLINSIDENNEGWRGDLEDIENDLE